MSKSNAPDDDNDLEDLISSEEKASSPKPASLPPTNVCLLLCSYIRYVCATSPKICTCVMFLVIGLLMVLVVNYFFNPYEFFGNVKNDYTNIQSEYDLSMSKIDHWCLKGDNKSCRCEDPLVPLGRQQFKTWVRAHNLNKKDITNYLEEHDNESPEVVFLGESLIEEMDGRWMGRTTETLQKIGKIFNKHFTKDKGKSQVDGLALGIAGDTSPNVLWRLLHGEMPAEFNPKVWWVSLGMNDLGRMQCSEEVVIIGILRIVEEIMKQKPDAKIVINSMLPMADLRGGLMPLKRDYLDAFTKYKGAGRGGMNRGGRGNTANPERFAQQPNRNSGGGNGNNKKNNKNGDRRILGLQHNNNNNNIRRNLGRNKPSPKVDEEVVDAKPRNFKGGKNNNNGNNSNNNNNDGKNKKQGKNNEDVKKQKKIDKKEKKEFVKKIKRDMYNPIIKSKQERIKKYNAKKLFTKQNKIPLWTSISSINAELKKFANKHNNVQFFDSTPIFAEREEGDKYMLLSEMISVRGHPTEEGYKIWEKTVYDKVMKMIEKDVEQEKKKEDNEEED